MLSSAPAMAGLRVTQTYAPAPLAPTTLFQVNVTLLNTGSTTLTDVRYRRVMDWDMPPTEFSEFVTHVGVPAALIGSMGRRLLGSSDDGFHSADPRTSLAGFPLLAGTVDVDFDRLGPTDHGSLFTFGFDDLAPGESVDFTIFYGAAANRADAIAAITGVGAELYSLGQSSTGGVGGSGFTLGTPATFIFGFAGIGGMPTTPPPPPGPGAIPEPSGFALLGIGLLGALGYGIRRFRK